MQDEYNRSFGKIRMGDERKMEMRKTLEKELASSKKPAKITRLSGGKKAGIAAAAVVVTLSGLFLIPTTRNTIMAAVKSLFFKEVPEDAVDIVDYYEKAREERVIPTDIPEASEVLAAVSEQDAQVDEYIQNVSVDAEYYEDGDLNELANYYAQQGYTLLDLNKDPVIFYTIEGYEDREWFSDGFRVNYDIGNNNGNIVVFKATEEQFQAFMDNQLALVNYERRAHNQATVSFDELWTKTTDDEGHIVCKASWTGPEPEVKLNPTDCARFINYEVTYDPDSGLAVCSTEDGGGVG